MAEKRLVYLLKDRQERYNMKRAWFVNAWRLVDKDGNDALQPWCDTKGEALRIAKALGWIVMGMYSPPHII